jgi:hypothetical protein
MLEEIKTLDEQNIEFPIKINLSISNYNAFGGAKKDFNYITCYLNNNENKYLIGEADDKKKYIFEFENNLLNKKEFNHEFKYQNETKKILKSSYINSGAFSTAIAIKLTEPFIEIISKEILVLKILGYNKHKNSNMWNKRYYGEQYIPHKTEYGNLLLDIYFYGDDIINKYFDKNFLDDVEFKDFYNNKKLGFNITKFYKSLTLNNTEIKHLKIYVLKMLAVLFYFYKKNIFLNDLKYDNIGCDQNNNLVLIDYDERHYGNFYDYSNKKHIHATLPTASILPIYLRKLIYSLIYKDIHKIKDIIKSREEFFDIINTDKKKDQQFLLNRQFNYLKNKEHKDFFDYYKLEKEDEEFEKLEKSIIEQDKLEEEQIKNKTTEEEKIENKIMEEDYLKKSFSKFNYSSNIYENILVKLVLIKKMDMFKIRFDKYNCSGLFQILLTLFFSDYTSIYINNGEKNLKGLISGNTIKNKKGKILELNKNKTNEIENNIIWHLYYHSLNDISKLNELVNDFLEPINPLDPENVRICERLKKLFFDNVSETGLLAPEFDDIPPFDLVFKYLYNSLNFDEIESQSEIFEEKTNENDIGENKINYNKLFLKLIKENIRDDIEIDYTITDQEYDEWIFERIRTKLTTKYEDIDVNKGLLLIPPENSKYKEHYEKSFVFDGYEEKKVGGYNKNNFKKKYLKYKQKYQNLKYK